MDQRIRKFLTGGWGILIGISAGILLGWYRSRHPESLAWTGDCSRIYVRLLEMCVIPILFSAVAASIGNLVTSEHARRYLGRIVGTLAILVLLSSSLGAIVALQMKPGELSIEKREKLGGIATNAVSAIEMTINSAPPEERKQNKLLSFLHDAIPANGLRAFTAGINLQILVLAIILGTAVGLHAQRTIEDSSNSLLKAMNELYACFAMILGWIMKLLPLGLCLIIGEATMAMSKEVLSVLQSLILCYCVACLILFIACTLILSWRSGLSIAATIKHMKEPVVIALSTRSSIASIPSAIQSLTDRMGFESDTAKLVLPLGITIGRFGNGLYFSVVAVFVAQLYGQPMNIGSLFLLVSGAACAGMATSGGNGIATLGMLSIVLSPLRLPLETILTLLIAIDTLVDPLRTLINVYVGCASTALIGQKSSSVVPTENKEEASECAVVA